MSESRRFQVGSDGSIVPCDLNAVPATQAASDDGSPFVWIDVVDPNVADLAAIAQRFNLHPLAIEDAVDPHEHAKIDPFENFWFIVFHTFFDDPASDELKTTETAIFAGDNFVVTVRHEPAWRIDPIERSWRALTGLRRDTGAFVYTILDQIVDDYLPFVQRTEVKLDEIETHILSDTHQRYRSKAILSDILQVKQTLQLMRHVVGPLQDVIARIARGDIAIFGRDEMVYYRDVGSRVKRLIARIDALNDMVTTMMSLNASTLANRQADVSRQLTIIATIFLPLSYITGFFGQNFGFLVNQIGSRSSFLIWGLGAEIVAVLILAFFFVRRRWI